MSELEEYSDELCVTIVALQPMMEHGYTCEISHGTGALLMVHETHTMDAVYCTPWYEGQKGIPVSVSNEDGETICDQIIPMEPTRDALYDILEWKSLMVIFLENMNKLFMVIWSEDYGLDSDASLKTGEHDVFFFDLSNGYDLEYQQVVQLLHVYGRVELVGERQTIIRIR